jgi:hypothetical protein
VTSFPEEPRGTLKLLATGYGVVHTHPEGLRKQGLDGEAVAICLYRDLVDGHDQGLYPGDG